MSKPDLTIGTDYEKKPVLFVAEKHFKGGNLDKDAVVLTANTVWQPFRVITNAGQETRSHGIISEGRVFQWGSKK